MSETIIGVSFNAGEKEYEFLFSTILLHNNGLESVKLIMIY